MTTFFIINQGKRLGPYTESQLKAHAAKGFITPQTLVETDMGHRGYAGQMPGLMFSENLHNTTDSPNGVPDVEHYNPEVDRIYQYRFVSDAANTSLLPILTDITFRDLKPETIWLWLMKGVYFAGIIMTIIGAVVSCIASAYYSFHYSVDTKGYSLLGLFYIPLILMYCCIGIILLRFFLELSIIQFHYGIEMLIEISRLPKAFRRFLEKKSANKPE